MNFRDRLLTCEVCGKKFIFTVTEQRNIYDSGQAEIHPETGEIVSPSMCPSCGLRDPDTGRWQGRVKWFNVEKGYGFIVMPNAEEIFFHRSQVDEEELSRLDEGVQVSFDQVMTDRGAEAQQVKLEST
jgi:CspA family cold shock protein